MAKTGKRTITDALRWQNFDDIMYAFFDLGRLLHMKDSKIYQIESRHIGKYGVIAQVIVMEQFCREMIKIQADAVLARSSLQKSTYKGLEEPGSEDDVLLNFQNIPIITRTLERYGIRGIFDGDDGARLRQIVGDLISARHDAVHTVVYPRFDVLDGYEALEAVFRRMLDLSIFENSSNVDIARVEYEIHNGNHDVAKKIMRIVISMKGESHNILYNKGIAWNKLEMYERAAECLKKLVVARPDDLKALIQLGIALRGMDQKEEEIKCYDRVLQQHPNDVTALGSMCTELYDLGRKNDAGPYINRLLAMEPEDPLDIFYKGMALGSLDWHVEARECIEKALMARPGDPGILFAKSAALTDTGRHEEALECIDAVLSAWHGSKDALLAKAVILGNLGRHVESAECKRLAES